MERPTREEELELLARRSPPTTSTECVPSGYEREDLERVAQVVVVELVVADPVQFHHALGGHEEHEHAPEWTAVGERCQEPTGRRPGVGLR